VSASNETQNPLFGTANIEPLDEWYAAIENLVAVGDANSINIPWLLGISVSIGNATTQAIAKNCIVFSDPDYDDQGASGLGKMGMTGGGSGEGGGVYVQW
jgi:hypothetical protein